MAEVSPALQVRLLRVLQERTYEPLGATRSEKAEVRIIVATNKDLAGKVRQGAFREDLYYRVNVVRIELPPLRRRKEDIPLLVEQFAARFNRIQQKSVSGVTAEALSLLMAHDWSGNVRELENAIERSFILCTEGAIDIGHLPEDLTAHRVPRDGRGTMKTARELLEAQTIRNVLERNAYSRLATARELGIHKSTLFRKLRRLGIILPPKKGRSKSREQ
jgi:transcriptional regulator with PAS, ATPase and Fis domain